MVDLLLHLTVRTARSAAAVAYVRRLADRYLCSAEAEIVDAPEQPEAVEGDDVVATPTGCV